MGKLFSWRRQYRPSDRKLRLFAVACYRRGWYQATDERSQKAVDVAESLADGLVSPEDRVRHWDVALQAAADTTRAISELRTEQWNSFPINPYTFGQPGDVSLLDRTEYPPHLVTAMHATVLAEACLRPAARRAATIATEYGTAAEAALLREILGNPFRPVKIDPAWLRWRDGAIVCMARLIYDARRFQDLPILADALEEAGCTDPEILGHCRGPGEHVRGCWPVDLILGKG
jgi:hypothetical protein